MHDVKNIMKEKQFDPARQNTISPAPGLASVNTHNPGEEPVADEQETDRERMNAGQQEKQAVERSAKPGDFNEE
jgi:hypothetical protein